MSALKVAGKSYPRRESALKVTGRALYTGDLAPPEMVCGAVLRSPHAHARVVAIDVAKARRVPGVLGVLLPQDVPRLRFNCAGSPPSPLMIRDEQVLTDQPRYAGDRIAAVVAETRSACEKALRRISVEYDVLPAVFTVRQALAENALPIQPQLGSRNIAKTISARQGDVAEGLARSDLVLSETFHTPMVQHAALEPIACICHYTRSGALTVWSTTQTPFQERRLLSEILGLPENRIRIIKPIMGGGFGARQQVHNQHVGALLSKLVRRPVQIINSREEEMYASVVRHETEIRLKIGVNQDGLLQTFDAELFFNAGPYVSHSPTVAAAASRKLQYRVPHYRYRGHCVLTNAPVAGAMRGYGNPQLTFAREVLLDRAATELGLDPVAFRLRNHVGVGDKFPAARDALQSCAIEDCVAGAARIKQRIDIRTDDPGDTSAEGMIHAWGVSFACHTSGPSSKEGMSACVIMANDDGSVQLLTGSADIGQGSETALSQVAAEILGLALADVAVTAADTRHTPYDTGTFASSQTYVAGNAVKRAAEDLLDRLKKALGNIHGIAAEQIAWNQHEFRFPAGTDDHCLKFKQAIREVTFQPQGKVLIGSSGFKAGASPPPFAVCWAQVAVDRHAHSIKLLHVIEAVDVGTAINPEIVTGQVEGGIAMAVGYAMMEQIEIDPRARKPISADLLHYRLPLATDMPQTHVYIAQSYEPTGPLGAKSVGELATVPVAPAIANAVGRALGRPINRLPLSGIAVPGPYRLSANGAADKTEAGRA